MDISTSQLFQTAVKAGNASASQAVSTIKASTNNAAAEKVAKSFESVLLNKLCDAMQATVPDSGLLEGGMEQTQSIFWLYLSQDVGSKGGLGLWKQLYKQIQKDGMGSSLSSGPSAQAPSLAQGAFDAVGNLAEEAGAW